MTGMWLVLFGSPGPSTGALVDAASALGAEVTLADTPEEIPALPDGRLGCAVIDLDGLAGDESGGLTIVRALVTRGITVVAVGAGLRRARIEKLFKAGARDVIAAPLHKRELILRLSATIHGKLRVACIGGGTGLFELLTAMRDIPRVLLSSIVTMSDDGGSSGRLRTHFGVLPPGDVRRSLVALANAPDVMNFVMQYRFQQTSELTGHSLGNLLLTALSDFTGGMQNAVKALGDLLNVQGIVMCVTERATTLCAECEDGLVIRGESAIDQCRGRASDLRIRRVWQEPEAETSIDVYASILGADLVVIGPGDLYTSVLSGLVIGGVAEAIRACRGTRLYICNLMTKPGETTGYDVADHVAAVEGTLGGEALDHVLVSSTPLDAHALEHYAGQSQHPVAFSSDERLRAVTKAEIITRDVGHRAQLVRHDSVKLREHLLHVIGRRHPSMVALARTPPPQSERQG